MTVLDQDATWFLAQLKPNSVAIADRNLTRQGFATFVPLEDYTRKHNGKFLTVSRPLFPGYIFVAVDVAQGHWRAVNSTQGITRLISFGDQPAVVPSDLMAELMARHNRAETDAPEKVFSPGDAVRVTSGPFFDLVAEIERISADRRIWLLMDMMGGKTKVSVSPRHIRPA
ncbi:MAG: transcriptional activator RfaH [Aestuariivita sp.]|uniref:transcription termination/antitermination protein NusG n=1 Tax=Aestuariivita sp. TaxID=1872407 RepID=UPI003BB09152